VSGGGSSWLDTAARDIHTLGLDERWGGREEEVRRERKRERDRDREEEKRKRKKKKKKRQSECRCCADAEMDVSSHRIG
jgi:alpha-galactosidase/6-phospho-beta-glucosidase family protein